MNLREKYKKETGEFAKNTLTTGTNGIGNEYYTRGYVHWLEAKLTKKEKPKAILFRDSEWFDFEKFTYHMAGKHSWFIDKSTYYYHAMLDWSDGITSAKRTEQKAIDWIRTALAWDRKEKHESTGFYKQDRASKDLETMKRMTK